MSGKAIIMMGSTLDFSWGREIGSYLKALGVDYEYQFGSAHKNPKHVLEFVESASELFENVVIIAVAGRSNALGGFIDSATHFPVINCPPKSDSLLYEHDVWSSLRTPSAIGCATVLEAEAAAIIAAKILALSLPELKERIRAYQKQANGRI